MSRLFTALMLLTACLFVVPAYAGGDDCGSNRTETQFMRNDLAALKKVMRGIVDAIGEVPAPYAKESDNWSLPTYVCRDKNGFLPISVTYDANFTTDALQKKLAEDAQKKMMEAQMRGDFQAIAEIGQQAQTQAMQSAIANEKNTPITINVSANDGSSETIDPDSVFSDGVGFIALKSQDSGASSGEEKITFYFDKVGLKDAQQIASFDLSGEQRVADKLAITSTRIDISGPVSVVEAIAKKVNTAAILKHLTEKRVEVKD